MFSIKACREIPGVLSIEGIADKDLPRAICPALLKVVAPGEPLIVMAPAAGSFRAVRNLAVDAQRGSISAFEGNLRVFGSRGGDGIRGGKEKNQ
jgi:hypothetical protein